MADETGDRERKFVSQTAAAFELSGYLINRIHQELHDIGARLDRVVERQTENVLQLERIAARVVRLEDDDEEDDSEARRKQTRVSDGTWDLIKLILAALFGVLAAKYLGK